MEWECTPLGEQVLLLKPQIDTEKLPVIHTCLELLENASLAGITDIIPAYESIALRFDHLLVDLEREIEQLSSLKGGVSAIEKNPKIHEIPVCYELGMDWVEVITHIDLTKQEIIKLHTGTIYTLAMMGFLPGFLYLEGLPSTLTCPRKATPRSRIPKGSVGIGGDQTGVYSLESPGGWQIIGKTPQSFFKPEKDPPIQVKIGDQVQFYAISEQEYQEWNEGAAK